MGMDMVTKGVHNVIEFLSDDSPDMDVIGISDNFFSDINKPVAEHSENILPSSEGDVGLTSSSGPSVLGDKVDEECAAADPPEISDVQNNRKRCLIRREIGNKVLKTSVSGLVELNILKNLTVYVVAGSLGRFKSHASNIVFDVFIATCQDPAQNMESSQIDGSH
ncbi:hypothetical protein F2Q69_00008842 [Brassica cretica]|uniref:Uncharacterized protein n=1 Tax=Brassica cretica TaxID=69181 RepID=A0A8S9NXK6_BRACR|nr:hypothetical protein F2Q69_00008842 [Brassica cretica]